MTSYRDQKEMEKLDIHTRAQFIMPMTHQEGGSLCICALELGRKDLNFGTTVFWERDVAWFCF